MRSFVRKADKKLKKTQQKNRFGLTVFCLDTVLFTWIMLYLWFSFVSACLMQPAFQSVQVIKKKKRNNKKRENAEWLFSDGVFLNFKALVFRMHAADMFFADVPGGGSGERRARRPGNTRTRQVCAANAVTWRLWGRLRPKQMKRCLMAAFIKFTRRAGGGGWRKSRWLLCARSDEDRYGGVWRGGPLQRDLGRFAGPGLTAWLGILPPEQLSCVVSFHARSASG